MIESANTLTRADFSKTLQDDLAPIGTLIGQRCRKT